MNKYGVGNLRIRLRGIVMILTFMFIMQSILLGSAQADVWIQTSQSDFDAGTKTNVDTISDPGNVILTQGWIKNESNPVLDLGPPGSWESNLVWAPRVIYEGGKYHMWYSGDNGRGRIGYANSTDGVTWTRHPSNPVFGPGPDTWEKQSVYVPTVYYDGTTYHMWYTGYSFSNVYRIGYANSTDGINWNRYPGNPIIDLGPPNSWEEVSIHATTVIHDGSTYHMWYSAENSTTHRIGYANSINGLDWTRHPENPVLDTGPPGSWDDTHVFYPTVHYNDITSTYHMWYIG
ncbi:MAG: hypothetical protein JSW00_08580, partial [Thermoplasmata archaeon]